jgi:hypothetical protein
MEASQRTTRLLPAYATNPADVRCTPGAINPDVTQATIGKTICVPGWTAKIRPPVAYTNLLKTSQMIEYGETGLPSELEEDRLINLGIGGAAGSPQPVPAANEPDLARPR